MPATFTNVQNQFSFSLASAVAAGGTVTLSYPGGGGNGYGNQYSKGNYLLTNTRSQMQIGQNIYNSPNDFELTFNANASGITLTNRTSSTWPQGSICLIGLNLSGQTFPPLNSPPLANSGLLKMYEMALDLGSPTTAAANNVAAAQAVAGAANLTLNGTLVTSGVAIFDSPRGMQLVSSNAGDTTQVATITGVDEYGSTVVETITLNGTTIVSTKKAMVAVTRIAMSAVMTGNITVGTSTVLGLPIAVYSAFQIVKEGLDGAVATAGTFAAAVRTKPTAATGDVRGTYIPNSAPNSDRGFVLIVSVPDPSDIGVAQFGG